MIETPGLTHLGPDGYEVEVWYDLPMDAVR
jgi:hypothetical protein